MRGIRTTVNGAAVTATLTGDFEVTGIDSISCYSGERLGSRHSPERIRQRLFSAFRMAYILLMRKKKRLFWICMMGYLGMAAGCGNEPADLPAGVLARVRDQTITESALEPAMVGRRTFVLSAINDPLEGPPPPYWLRSTASCVATLSKREDAKRAGGDGVRRRCARERRRAQLAGLSLLVRGVWYDLEARRLKIRLPKISPENLAPLSQASGVRLADLEALAPIYQRRALLVARRYPGAGEFTRAEIAEQFKMHKDRYVSKDTWYVDAAVIKTQRNARRVATAFGRGRSSAQIVRHFRREGARRSYERHLQDVSYTKRAALRRAVRPLGKGDVGMVRDPRGWYVFRVMRIVPATAPDFETAALQVEHDLQVRAQNRRNAIYDQELRSHYRRETICTEEYRIPECR